MRDGVTGMVGFLKSYFGSELNRRDQKSGCELRNPRLGQPLF